MGKIKFKRPIDARTKGATDLYFDVATSTGSMTVPTISSTASVTSVQYKRTGITQSTAASTALSARGIIEIGTSSTTAAANYILTPITTVGEEITVVLALNGSTFGASVNASTATIATFGAVAATTGQIRIAMTGVLGNSFSAVAISTSRWLVTNQINCTFSTAAA